MLRLLILLLIQLLLIAFSSCFRQRMDCGEGNYSCPPCMPVRKVCELETWGSCHSYSWQMDGVYNDMCLPITKPCNGFICPSGDVCIPNNWVCDKKNDCCGGEDEKDCNESCTEDQFVCSETPNSCIDTRLVCDGNKDCDNGTDEHGCDASSPTCKENNGGCQQRCVGTTSSPSGRVCQCHAGFQLVIGSQTDCEDINECEFCDTCSQICINTKGSYRCECVDGYVLRADNRYCKADSESSPRLIVSDEYGMSEFDLLAFNKEELMRYRGDHVVELDFDVRNDMLYWLSEMDEYPYSLHIPTSKIKLIFKDMSYVTSLAVDWVHGNLYLGRPRGIIVTRLDGTQKKVLLSDQKPTNMAIDPYHGWLYWTSNRAIKRVGMNGKERKTIVIPHTARLVGLTIDRVANRLYFTDDVKNFIASTDMEGNDFRFTATNLNSPRSVALFEDFIYWTQSDNNLRQKSKFGTGKMYRFGHLAELTAGLVVQHISNQPIKLNHCGENYGGCSHLCLPVPQNTTGTRVVRKYECACPDGLLLKDGYTCVDRTEIVTTPPAQQESPENTDVPTKPESTTTTPKYTSRQPEEDVQKKSTLAQLLSDETSQIWNAMTNQVIHDNARKETAVDGPRKSETMSTAKSTSTDCLQGDKDSQLTCRSSCAVCQWNSQVFMQMLLGILCWLL